MEEATGEEEPAAVVVWEPAAEEDPAVVQQPAAIVEEPAAEEQLAIEEQLRTSWLAGSDRKVVACA